MPAAPGPVQPAAARAPQAGACRPAGGRLRALASQLVTGEDASPVPQDLPRSPPPAQPEEQVGLFRKAAVDALHGAAPLEREMPKPGASSWGLLAAFAVLTLSLIGGAALASVEVTVKAPGVLRTPNGLRSVESVIEGSVKEVLVRAGDAVEEGQVLARLEEARLRATLALREQALRAVTAEIDGARTSDRSLLHRTRRALSHRRYVQVQRADIKLDRKQQRLERLDRMRSAVQQGVASLEDTVAAQDLLGQAAEEVASLAADVADLDVQLAQAENSWDARELQRTASLAQAQASVDEARSLLDLAVIRSPSAGRVESLLVTPGAVVQPGSVLAQVVPSGAPRSIVAFLPTRETAFVSVGNPAKVEVESLAVAEFGMADATVSRVSADVAQPEELATVLGENVPGSFVRVELDLVDTDGLRTMAPHLRSGERLLVRLHQRERRVLSLLFDFVRKWLGQ